MHLRKLLGGQGRGKLPSLVPHRIVAKATGESALNAVNLAVQVVMLHVADHLVIQVQPVQR